MRNLGPNSRKRLAEIDLHSLQDIRAVGAVETYARLRFRFGKTVNRNMLHALAAALEDIDWRQLSSEDKAALDRQAKERLANFNMTED